MELRALGTGGPLVSRLGLGLAALGRPAYVVLGHGDDFRGKSDVASMRSNAFEVLDAAWAAGIRYVDAARSYGRAEEFLSQWLDARDLVIGSKWGYLYTGDWKLDAPVHEVKDHSLAALERQWEETRALLGGRLALYQVHSATLESGVLDHAAVLRRLFELQQSGVRMGVSVSGPRQAEVIRRAIAITVDGQRLFTSVQATWNLLERSAGDALAEAHAAGLGVIIKEGVANGRLTIRGGVEGRHGHAPDAVALAAVLQNEWVDVALSGASSVAQLHSNLHSLDVPAAVVDEALTEVKPEAPAAYWGARTKLRWT